MLPSLAFLGGPALSPFRLGALLERLQSECPATPIARIETAHVYAVDLVEPLGDKEHDRLAALLGTRQPLAIGDGFLVMPRRGTISPWSSKATDIVRNCGLLRVRRVERGMRVRLADGQDRAVSQESLGAAAHRFYDRMTQRLCRDAGDLFPSLEPPPGKTIDVLAGGLDSLGRANRDMGLALRDAEMTYLLAACRDMGRNPTDTELVMFGQVNSEHCRHKIFNAEWRLDGEPRDQSLFDMIRHTHAVHPDGTLVAYRDNSGVVEGFPGGLFEPDAAGVYRTESDQIDLIMKVETHNHPTAISPFPGAATGVGGEIRDEGATGTGARSKAGLGAFMVGHLRIPGFAMPWEQPAPPFPGRLATPLEIMTEGPIGGAGFGNEFGRPQLFGLFRPFEETHAGRFRGYYKPIMAAGGMGIIRRGHVHKHAIPPGALIVQLGGPAMRIGLGGGAASSMATGSNAELLDFDSVQRDNAEMQRRCQEVINACAAMNAGNPILSIHDIGAGGLSNGCPELVADVGGAFRLRDVPSEDASMSPMEIWCCEAQERYVLAVDAASRERFEELCARERCPMAVIGRASGDGRLTLDDARFGDRPIDLDLAVLLGKPPRLAIDARRRRDVAVPLALDNVPLDEAVERVLMFPAVACKTFLITIADRTVTGCVARDQMVGPYQTPVADAAVTVNTYDEFHGQAMTMGERTPVALLSGPASGRLAVGEALTNLAGVDVGGIGNVKLSGNWMCACGEDGEDAALYDTVEAVAMKLCPALGVSIPVGKDSLSMRTVWEAEGQPYRQVAPLSLIVSAFAPVPDVRRVVTPDLKEGGSLLLLVDLGGGRNRVGGSVFAQVYNQMGETPPDVDEPDTLRLFFTVMQSLVREGRLLAYHDRSDGGLIAAVAEMAFAGRRGVELDLDVAAETIRPALFAEELGGVLQVAQQEQAVVMHALARAGLAERTRVIGRVTEDRSLAVLARGAVVFKRPLTELLSAWMALTHRMQRLRDNPACADAEVEGVLDPSDPGMTAHLTFAPRSATYSSGERPRVAVLREQGVNGHVEMAAAFDKAGFTSVDVHMTDLLSGRRRLAEFAGLVACGGFSYGDVLGAGAGWARSILFNDALREDFRAFFENPDTFALGVCNGCQMMAQLKAIIPGAANWPRFVRNTSEQFEARFVTVEILRSPSIFFADMAGSRLPVPVAHGEGRVAFDDAAAAEARGEAGLAAVRYVDNRGAPTERYPLNPNGSSGGLTGFTTPDGRVTILMPHPERAFRTVQLSYAPPGLFTEDAGPWLRMFENARAFVAGKA